MNLLNAGCGTHIADGWVNTDVWSDGTTRPDVVVEYGKPYPFPDDHFDATYLGHVIEHIPWNEVPGFILDMCRITKPGAPILIVGPDVIKTLNLWKANIEPWHMVLSTMEHQSVHYHPGSDDEVWYGAAHHWNCHNERVMTLLNSLNLPFEDVYTKIPNNPGAKTWFDSESAITWPVVGKHHWQFALKITNP